MGDVCGRFTSGEQTGQGILFKVAVLELIFCFGQDLEACIDQRKMAETEAADVGKDRLLSEQGFA